MTDTTPTQTSTAVPSPNPGSVISDHEAQTEKRKLGDLDSDAAHLDHSVHPLAQLSNIRKNVLLLIFAISTFVDVCNGEQVPPNA
jgi:hypothetical protein